MTSENETREALFDPRFEPTGNNEFRLIALFARQTKADYGWNQEAPRPVTLLENLSPQNIAAIIAAGGEALATTVWNQYNEITTAAWHRDREQRDRAQREWSGITCRYCEEVIFETTGGLWEAPVDGGAAALCSESPNEQHAPDPDQDQSAEDDAAVDGILARIESSACDQ